MDISPGNLDSSLCFIQPSTSITYSSYKLKKQAGNIQPWCTPFPIQNQSIVPCPVLSFLTCIQISQEACRVVWYSSLRIFQFVVIHTVKGFSIDNEADIFLEFSCFFNDPMDAGNLISGTSALSKSSLNIWKFTVHVLLKPGLGNFGHYFASVWDECNCAIVWTFFGIAFFRIGTKTDLFQSCGHCWVFQICWYIECSTFTVSSFMIWNNSAGIPSPPLALFIVMNKGPLDFAFQDVWL